MTEHESISDKAIYLSSPYTHRNTAIENLRYLATMENVARLVTHEIYVYSPIVHCHELTVMYGLLTDFPFWRDYNRVMIHTLPQFAVLTLPGHEASGGVKDEIDFAKELGREIQLFPPSGRHTDLLCKLAQ